MIGEIRDQETAEIAIRAALTGHLDCKTKDKDPHKMERLPDIYRSNLN